MLYPDFIDMVLFYSNSEEYLDPHMSDEEMEEKRRIHEEKLKALGNKT
jgi:hypothetical protein